MLRDAVLCSCHVGQRLKLPSTFKISTRFGFFPHGSSYDRNLREMEAVAAVSSIAGILSLVGQALNGVILRRGIFNDCASASESISLFMKRLNDLMQCLQDVEMLMTKIRNSPSQAVSDTVLASLQIQLDDCSKDIYIWLGVGKKLMPDSSTAAKAVFKKFLVTLEKQKVKDIYQDILVHKDTINTKLSVIRR